MSKLKKILISIITILVLSVIGGIYWYFGIHVNTPAYALQKIEYALETHDKNLFYKYVDTPTVLSNAYDAILKSVIDSDATRDEATKVAAMEAVKILKAPMLHGFQKAIDSYIENGSWNKSTEKSDEVEFDIKDIVEEAGIKSIKFRGITEIIENNENEAIALAKIYHSELEREFVFEIVLNKTEKKWKIVEIKNLEEFIISIKTTRKEKIQNYITESNKIWQEHETKMRDADFDLQRILSAKSLGKSGTRGEIKTLMTDTVANDWKERKSELEALDVPKEVLVLHKLKLKIAELHIEYAEGYSAWLDDKKASTLRTAEDKIKQARTLENEANILQKRIEGK